MQIEDFKFLNFRTELKKKKGIYCLIRYNNDYFGISPHTSTAFNGYFIIVKLVPKLGD